MDDLVTWLRAQLNEDERKAQEVTSALSRKVRQGGVFVGMTSEAEAWEAREQVEDFYVRHGPARVLAEIAAKRAIVELHRDADGVCVTCAVLRHIPGSDGELFAHFMKPVVWPCPTLRHLTAAYADRPGYRPEWAPDADPTVG